MLISDTKTTFDWLTDFVIPRYLSTRRRDQESLAPRFFFFGGGGGERYQSAHVIRAPEGHSFMSSSRNSIYPRSGHNRRNISFEISPRNKRGESRKKKKLIKCKFQVCIIHSSIDRRLAPPKLFHKIVNETNSKEWTDKLIKSKNNNRQSFQ